MIATIANTSIVFRCFELRSFPIKSIDASMPQSSVEANIAARSAGNSEFCDIARRMPGIAIEMKDRKSVVWGKSVAVRVDLGGRGIIKKKNTKQLRSYGSLVLGEIL